MKERPEQQIGRRAAEVSVPAPSLADCQPAMEYLARRYDVILAVLLATE